MVVNTGWSGPDKVANLKLTVSGFFRQLINIAL